MDTQLLEAFLAVAQQQSFSLAANQLKLTQSAVSKRIALLEEQLACILFDRVGRQTLLTEVGHTLLPYAIKLLEDTEHIGRLIKEQRGDVSGVLRIATSHHIGVHRLPPFLKAYTQQYPNVHLKLHFVDSEKAAQAILQSKFDLAIITLPDTQHDDGSDRIQQHILWQDPMHFVIGHTHALQGKKRISIQQLSEYPAILPDDTTRTTQLVKQLFLQQDKPLNISMATNHLDAIKMMVGVGLGWSALPERLIDHSLYRLPINKVKLSRQLGCVHHRQRTLSNAARAMLNCLKNNMA